MPDTPVEKGRGGPYDPAMEARVSRLEDEVRIIRDVVVRTEAMLAATLPNFATRAALDRVEAIVAATLPTLATRADLTHVEAGLKAELAEKPSKTYLWGILGVLVTAILGAFGAGLAAVAILH